jgi:hypothetical protein
MLKNMMKRGCVDKAKSNKNHHHLFCFCSQEKVVVGLLLCLWAGGDGEFGRDEVEI